MAVQQSLRLQLPSGLPNSTPRDRAHLQFLQQVQQVVQGHVQSGQTSDRPTTGLYVGRTFFDRNVGYTVVWNGTEWVTPSASATFTADSFIYGGSSGALTSSASATNGQILIGSTGEPPVANTISGGKGISVVNGAGSISIANTGIVSAVGQANQITVSVSNNVLTVGIAPTYPGQASINTLGTITTGTWHGTIIGTLYGGTGVNGSAAANGSLLIGNGTGYTLATLGSSTGISISNGSGSITINNTGVTSNVAGTGVSVSGATGAVTITNTGVTSIVAGTNITISGATGAVTINASNSVGTATNIAGGAASELVYQTGSGVTGFISNGTAGTVLTSAGTSAPTWSAIPSQFTTTTTSSATYNESATSGFKVVGCDATSGAITVNLPAASSSQGVVLTYKKVDSGVHAVTVTAAGSDKIDGSGTNALSLQYAYVTVTSTGSAWLIIGAGST